MCLSCITGPPRKQYDKSTKWCISRWGSRHGKLLWSKQRCWDAELSAGESLQGGLKWGPHRKWNLACPLDWFAADVGRLPVLLCDRHCLAAVFGRISLEQLVCKEVTWEPDNWDKCLRNLAKSLIYFVVKRHCQEAWRVSQPACWAVQPTRMEIIHFLCFIRNQSETWSCMDPITSKRGDLQMSLGLPENLGSRMDEGCLLLLPRCRTCMTCYCMAFVAPASTAMLFDGFDCVLLRAFPLTLAWDLSWFV